MAIARVIPGNLECNSPNRGSTPWSYTTYHPLEWILGSDYWAAKADDLQRGDTIRVFTTHGDVLRLRELIVVESRVGCVRVAEIEGGARFDEMEATVEELSEYVDEERVIRQDGPLTLKRGFQSKYTVHDVEGNTVAKNLSKAEAEAIVNG